MPRRRARIPVLLVPLAALALAGCGTGTSASVAVSAPADPTATPQPPASDTPAPLASATPQPPASDTPEPLPSDEPAGDELDWTLPPNFGSIDLVAGFTPDPHEESVTSGGPIDASYLGGDCRGWATAAPDFDVTYQAGSMTLLRFYFVADEAGEDTTIIVNAPDGNWYCNDDASGGTLDPMIDFTSPQSGLYDIWIGSYDEGTAVSGTLFVTELSSNSP
jgi:hypothetical protein